MSHPDPLYDPSDRELTLDVDEERISDDQDVQMDEQIDNEQEE